MSDKKFIPEDAYVLVSQGIPIYWCYSKEVALEKAKKNNEFFLQYKQYCFDNDEPYADNAVYVFYRGEMIADEYGEVKGCVRK